jgi:hypothetical protein
MAGTSTLGGRIFASLGVDDFELVGVVSRRAPVLLNDTPRFGGIFFPNQNDGAPHAGKNILRSVQSRHIGLNALGFQQAANHHCFGLLLGIENPYELFVGVRALVSATVIA